MRMPDDISLLLRNTIAGYEQERLDAAEREDAMRRSLEATIERMRAESAEREADLLDIIRECKDAILEAIPHAETSCMLPLRTIAARAEDVLR